MCCSPWLFSERDKALFKGDLAYQERLYLEADTATEIVDHFSCTNLLWLRQAGRQENSRGQGDRERCIQEEGRVTGALSTTITLPTSTAPPWAFLPSCSASWAIRSVGSSCVPPGQLFPLHASCAARSCGEMMSYLILRQAECLGINTERGWRGSDRRQWAGWSYANISDDLCTSRRKRKKGFQTHVSMFAILFRIQHQVGLAQVSFGIDKKK